MCDINDANTHERLAEIQSLQNHSSAHEHYLEAASIYTLLAKQQKDAILHRQANNCYQKAHALKNIKMPNLEIPELAHRTLHELDIINKHKSKHLKTHFKFTNDHI